jgi:filamentous hemagglutinin
MVGQAKYDEVMADLGNIDAKARIEARAQLAETLFSLALDLTPGVGDVKGFVEAQDTLDYALATIAVIPGGDLFKGPLKVAKEALKAGDIDTAGKIISTVGKEVEKVKALDVGSYKELKAREKVGDGLEHDHIPSFAAIKKNKENELGRPLTDAETKSLYQNATVVEVPKDVHAASPTYKGKNTAAQVQQDAANLCGAECRDTNVLRVNMVAQGYDPKLVEEAISKIIERNRQTGVIK